MMMGVLIVFHLYAKGATVTRYIKFFFFKKNMVLIVLYNDGYMEFKPDHEVMLII